MDAEVDSENSSAPGETGGQSQVCESSVARPLGSEAATPAAAADAAPGEGSLATGARDEGQAKAVIAQPGEPSLEAEKTPPGVGRNHEVGGSVAVASSTRQRLILLREASAALMTGIMRLLSVFCSGWTEGHRRSHQDALAALDRKDYAKAQALFESLGQKAPPAQVKGRRRPVRSPKSAPSAGLQSDPTFEIKPRQNL